MKISYLKPILCILSFLCLGFITSNAQELPMSSGGDAAGSGGSASYSIGQITYSTNIGTTGSVAQGVQQPYELSITTGQDELGINLNLSAFPNPTTDYLILQVDDLSISPFFYQLCDLSGKMIDQQEITNSQTRIIMESLSMSSYFLKVIRNHEVVKIFKIIKTK
jgi:hypothetical protein